MGQPSGPTLSWHDPPTLGATCFGHLDLGRRFLDPSPSSWGITLGHHPALGQHSSMVFWG